MKGLDLMKYQSINNYLDVYRNIISPKLAEIDLFIKTNEAPYHCDIVEDILNIPRFELLEILDKTKQCNSFYIDKNTFFYIMEHSSNFICGLYRRIIEIGNPLVYTLNDISYVYNIDISLLNSVCKELEISEVTNYMLPEILRNLPVPSEYKSE